MDMESYDESTWQPQTANWHMTVDEKRKLSSTTDGCDDNEVADGRTVEEDGSRSMSSRGASVTEPFVPHCSTLDPQDCCSASSI